MNNVNSFHETFARLIKERKVKQIEIAEKANVSKGYISAIISGRNPPPLDCLTHFCEALGLDEKESLELTHLAHLAHTPKAIQSLLSRLSREVEQSNQELSSLKIKLREAESKVSKFDANFSLLIALAKKAGLDVSGLH